MTARILNGVYVALTAVLLAGCASGGARAPVSERSASEKTPDMPIIDVAKAGTHSNKFGQPEKDWRPSIYVVQKGDTLYGIAFNHGLDYHEIKDLNNIQNPDLIQTGQELRLFSGNPAAGKSKVAEIKNTVSFVKDQPKVVKLPYSEQALVDLQKMQEAPHKSEQVAVVSQPETKPEAVADSGVADEAIEWGMPTNGKVIGEFSESANRKGIDIAGKQGQAVVASAAGKVVYSGSGLRGYGKLVIIKHNNTYLSAYAHNDQVLVKEGQAVTKGQKIAEMGNTDADQVELHFEIRKLGKPVDPAKFLSLAK